MDPQHPASDVLKSEVHGNVPTPVTPADGTERQDGVAFDLPAGTETPGMPPETSVRPTRTPPRSRPRAAEVPPGGLNPAGAGAS